MLTFKRFLLEAKIAASGKHAQRHFEKYIKNFLPDEPSHGTETHELNSDIISHEGEIIPKGERVSLHGHRIDNKGKHFVTVKTSKGNFGEIPVSSLKKPKDEAKYNDEHAFKTVWNHFIKQPNMFDDKQRMLEEIKNARKDKSHPLNFNNQGNSGFSGGERTPNHQDSYYEELERAVHTTHAFANHPEVKKLIIHGPEASVTGASRGKLSDIWKKHGATNSTSKSDIMIGSGKNAISVSLKKGDSQLMSAQPEEMKATYDHATNEYMTKNPNFTAEHKADIMDKIHQVHEHLYAMQNANKNTQKELAAKAQTIINNIHKDHPLLIDHISHEAATGYGKFGRNQTGSARFLVTAIDNGAHIHDTQTNNKPILPDAVPRIATPKGPNRPGNIKLDYKTKNL